MDCFFFQAEDGIRDLVRSRGLGDVYKRQALQVARAAAQVIEPQPWQFHDLARILSGCHDLEAVSYTHLTLPTSDLV